MAEENIGLHQQFELLKGVEQHKNKLIEVRIVHTGRNLGLVTPNVRQDLLNRLDKLSEDFQQEKLDHARESQFNRDVQRRELQLTDQLRKLKEVVVGHP
jgi:hypothetical protein